MTPGARVAAAIEVLDVIRAGGAAEQALTGWARGARYAGSKDRAAVRDHVFHVLRRWRSCAACGGGETGRALIIGALRDGGTDPAQLFTGEGHAPAPLGPDELQQGRPATEAEARDLPDWLWPHFERSLGGDAGRVAKALRHRAPVILRVNLQRLSRADARARLEAEGIVTEPVETTRSAMHVLEGERKVAQSTSYAEGLVELQDTSSQAAMEQLDLPRGARVLDYCAGGGGKVLALAARAEAAWFAHDIAPQRIAHLPPRAERAGVEVTVLATAALGRAGPFDLVLCDVPCSGSGTWRRSPQAKWRLTPERLTELTRLQAEILARAAALVAPGGRLVYTTCSVLDIENQEVTGDFTAAFPSWRVTDSCTWPVCDTGDGFYLAQIEREA
ncbi:ribosomal RNA small subunit methyltransferase B [Roseovarius sp. A-2]|uniref:RsmB/NOP family class I SAM-dependent RNA methyltransferase n=1 Tax=Roseovarius sp. A-2 TaxID=1570360 RepID=UPI0009B547A2|nr:RsmB/NOP family class I SAM-dependent RNA methyltransferase [Roseovarius sp. A-2]GAW33849.1 ribosomal RNA small subunit methyltransferase B [Roseovarius sp. A-2]